MDYTIWKKNSPLLYTQLQTSSLLWPSLSLDWLPDTTHLDNNDTYGQHRLLLSTYSNGINKFETIILTRLNLFDLNCKSFNTLQNFDYLPSTNEFLYSLPTAHLKNTNDLINISVNSNVYTQNDYIHSQEHNETLTQSITPSSDQQHEQQQLQQVPVEEIDTVKPPKINNSLGLIQRIPHVGDINRIKHCPQNPDLIATASNSGLIRIFDRTKKPNDFNDSDFQGHETESSSSTPSPSGNGNVNDYETIETSDILLNYHTSESWTLDWNINSNSTIATASNDGSIAIWNLREQFVTPEKKQKYSTLSSKYNFSTCTLKTPKKCIPAHDYGVNEVKWIYDHDSLLVSVGEDSKCKLWDIRKPNNNQPELQLNTSITDALNTIDVNPFQSFQLAAGSASGELLLLDIRNPSSSQITTSNHKGPITSSKYSPHISNTIATSSTDSTVCIWQDENPVFVHSGHLLAVNDVSWCPSKKGVLSSCSNDNSVHVWEPLI